MIILADAGKLSKEDADLFYELHWGLLFFVNQKRGIIPNLDEPNFTGQQMEKVAKLNQIAFSGNDWIDQFANENPQGFSEEKLEILRSWKKRVSGKLFLISHSPEGTIVLEPAKKPKAYCILGIKDTLEELIPFTPVIAEMTLLPFKGKITYSAFFSTYPITFGRNMHETIKADLRKAQATFGIFHSFDDPMKEQEHSDEELFWYYCASQERQYRFWNEIQEMLRKNPQFQKILDFENTKSYARRVSKSLRQVGVLKGTWFAAHGNTIVASGKTEEETKEQAHRILPPEKAEYVYIFRLK